MVLIEIDTHNGVVVVDEWVLSTPELLVATFRKPKSWSAVREVLAGCTRDDDWPNLKF